MAIVLAGLLVAVSIYFVNQGKVKESGEAAVVPAETGAVEVKTYSPAALESLAKCLTQKGAKFYGASWCGWCKKQKDLFGAAVQYLPYVECIDSTTQELNQACQAADIQGFPTWEFNGVKSPGYKEADKLAELSGCSLE